MLSYIGSEALPVHSDTTAISHSISCTTTIRTAVLILMASASMACNSGVKLSAKRKHSKQQIRGQTAMLIAVSYICSFRISYRKAGWKSDT